MVSSSRLSEITLVSEAGPTLPRLNIDAKKCNPLPSYLNDEAGLHHPVLIPALHRAFPCSSLVTAAAD